MLRHIISSNLIVSNAAYTNSEEGRNDKRKLTEKGMPYSFPYYILSTEWLLDSSAIVNGSRMKIVGYESTYISKHIIVHNVLYVHDCRSNITCYQLID